MDCSGSGGVYLFRADHVVVSTGVFYRDSTGYGGGEGRNSIQDPVSEFGNTCVNPGPPGFSTSNSPTHNSCQEKLAGWFLANQGPTRVSLQEKPDGELSLGTLQACPGHPQHTSARLGLSVPVYPSSPLLICSSLAVSEASPLLAFGCSSVSSIKQ